MLEFGKGEDKMQKEMKPYIVNYLMSCAMGIWDGALKADSHAKLVEIFIKHEGGDEDHVRFITRKLTDNLDTEIGFPTESAPNYRLLWRPFYAKFIEYARG